MQGKPRSILPLLGIGENQQWWLCHQTPCAYTSSGNTTNFPNPHQNSTRTTRTSYKLAVRFFFEERFLIGHGPTPLAYIPTYERTFHSTPHYRVEWNKYWVTQQKWFHSTRVQTYVQTYITLHSRKYLHTNVLSTPLHITEWSGMKKEYEFIQKTDAGNIARHWKSQMLKKLLDAGKASNLLPIARVC